MNTTPQLPPNVLPLVAQLAATVPAPASVWLIGSRANGRAHGDSDTDLLVFGSKAFMASASRSIGQPTSIDVLVVYDGNLFEDIWSRKTGSLQSWGWRILNDNEATYTGGKFVPDQDLSDELLETMRQNPNVQHGDFVHYEERAIKLWPK